MDKGFVDIKDNCFSRFYFEILDSIYKSFSRRENIPDISGLVTRLSHYTHQWDDFVEPDFLKSKEIWASSVESTKTKVYTEHIKRNIVSDMRETIGIDFSLDDLADWLDNISDYFIAEKEKWEGNPTEEEIRDMLHRGNCDFQFYTYIIKKHIIKEFGAEGYNLFKKLNIFLKSYLQLDLLLDHITDIDEDFEKSFNTLLWELKRMDVQVSQTNVHLELHEQGIYNQFYDIAIEFATQASKALEELKNYEPLHNLLSSYLKGEINGLKSFMDNNGYVHLPSEIRIINTIRDLKPEPWNRYRVDKVVMKKDVFELNKKLEGRAIIALGGNCEYMNCNHCGLRYGTEQTTFEEFLEDLESIEHGIDVLCLYTPGSFFKFSPSYREKILRAVNERDFRKVIVESRPELVTKENIGQLEEILEGMNIEIGIGLDHKDDVYRNEYLNKGISLKEYERAAVVISESKAKLITYIAIGCPYLTEEEAEGSAVTTTKYAIEHSNIISFEPIVIQDSTLQYQLYKQGKFIPPSKELITRVLNKAKDYAGNVEIRLGGVVQAPLSRGL